MRKFLTLLLLALSFQLGAQTRGLEEPAPTKGITEQIIRHKGFTVSYNDNLLIPNWVAWELTKEEAESKVASRTDEFLPDPAVKGYSASTYDYSNSGYVRGHMAPAADMKWDLQAMKESFYLTNVCPQYSIVNDGVWLELEQKCRYWAKKYGSIYICCGPIFFSQSERSIGQNEVAVPDAFFKTVLQKRKGRWVGASFIVLNLPQKANLMDFVNCIAVVELQTGYLLYAGLPEDIANQVKVTFSKEDWEIPGWRTK